MSIERTGTNGGCQSDCDQPDSGSSGGDVQSRVIGYYETWLHDRACQGMDFKDIPAGALTHLHFAFAYVTPGDFNIAPMDGNKQSLFEDFTAVTSQNPGLKAIVALGGWSFNDNGTATQPVFSDMVSSSPNRQKFITNVLAFMREYGFDGLDIDWEYPGAPDRGGQPDDGKNFVTFLKELKDAIAGQPVQYSVSFTAPTSYWYLRWFDLDAVNYVDYVNVMAYDLHGVWDSIDPIGSHIYAHTNLTEIKQAFDLFWRNKVPASKLNLGIGFYGRSFQLSDQSCYQPGCYFKGGGAEGPCTKNSGTLSYREITDIIKKNGIEPYHDKENAVKYMTYNQDNWISFDDDETFKQKIDWANGVGLGGLLIWAIDQDTENLDALSALLAPKEVNKFRKEAEDASFWQDVSNADCYVTDCGGTCKAGFLQITHQPCGGAKPITRHSKGKDSALCCPVSAAPDMKKCTWRGNAPSCNGHCKDDEVVVELNRWGDGDYCEDGNKALCCETGEHTNKCYWTGAGGHCKNGDETLTFAGTFLETIKDIVDLFPGSLVGAALDQQLAAWDIDLLRKFCCPPEEMKLWDNCKWHGTPGTCFDNHCDVGHQVQLANSKYGQGESCFPRVERERVFCCDATNGKSPFLPVPLEDLFPSPPTGDNIAVDTNLRIDDTWGDGTKPSNGADDPAHATFGFVVLASPQELQVSLDKRDGSDWEVFNCNDAISEEAQTVQMYCRNSDTTNCDQIHLGHGAEGTIIEMPEGCGPSRYAVVRSLVPSKSQNFPKHLEKRSYSHGPVIHDLTFDYDWHRVPRDLGDTQMRLDYSNEIGYWDSIVNKAGDHKKKRKRSLDEYNGNHKRWLEAELRDDMHFGGLSREELHKRWFGSDVIDWLKGFFNPSITAEYTHNFQEVFEAILIEEDWKCQVKGVDLDAHLLVGALMEIDVQTSFGITMIATLGAGSITFQDSYLYFKNKGEATATFTLDALGRATFGRDMELLNLGNFPGATFGIPNLVTVGPNFRLLGRVDAEITLAGHLESRARIASWDVQMTFPAANNDFMPQQTTDSKLTLDGTGDFQGLSKPTFDYSVEATGRLSAHIKPTIEFGIIFDKRWGISNAAVQLVADGSVAVSATAGTQGDCPFTYAVDVGARMYTHVDAPNFGWNIPDFDLFPAVHRTPISGATCPSKRDILDADVLTYTFNRTRMVSDRSARRLVKRIPRVGPPFHLPSGCTFCPKPNTEDGGNSCSGADTSDAPDPTTNFRRDIGGLSPLDRAFEQQYHHWDKRAGKDITFCEGFARQQAQAPAFDSSSKEKTRNPSVPIYGYEGDANECSNLLFRKLDSVPEEELRNFATEHVLEFQLLPIFFDVVQKIYGKEHFPNPLGTGRPVDFCHRIQPYWRPPASQWITVNGERKTPLQAMCDGFPGKDNQYADEFVLLFGRINLAKLGMWGNQVIRKDKIMSDKVKTTPYEALTVIKDVLSAWEYHMIPAINQLIGAQRNRIGGLLSSVQDQIVGRGYTTSPKSGDVTIVPYTKIEDLESRWNTWTHDRGIYARNRAQTFMDTYIAQLQTTYATDDLRKKANEQERRLIDAIDSVATAINNKAAWSLPF
ncbi:glycoside hydrolase, protein [Acrodontium crateriforme]|uniref:chitinase n=1 Tax=Acrodontium crateriforme TaxID=150365 RepID=A0AAQ3RBT9_9PEZI|nr:glycoside hydrolase, protein [Acrodontium crateriforme]